VNTAEPALTGWSSQPPSADLSPTVRQDRAQQTRALVLRCAGELFSEKGFHGTSVQDVATRAGMTKGAVYFHFPSKDILALAVVEEHYTRWPAILESVRKLGLSPFDTAVALLDRTAEAFATDPIVQAGTRLQLESILIKHPLPTPYVGWINLLSALLREAAEVGQLKVGVAPDAAARTIVAAFFGMQHISYTLNDRADLMERWQEVRQLNLFSLRT